MKIVFFDTGFYITIEEEGAARTPKRRVGTMRATSFVAKNPYGRAIILKQKKKPKDEKEKTASAKACFYDSWTGRKCFQVYVKARFTYNKKKKTCTMETLSHYAKKYHIETLLSQVHDVEYTENKDSKKKRSAVQSGYIRTGITIKGVGIVLSDHFASAFVGCDYRGKITKCSVTD